MNFQNTPKGPLRAILWDKFQAIFKQVFCKTVKFWRHHLTLADTWLVQFLLTKDLLFA